MEDSKRLDYEAWLKEEHLRSHLEERGERRSQRFVETAEESIEATGENLEGVSHRRKRYVQCWISNITAPASLEDLLNTLQSDDGTFNVEAIVIERGPIYWTAPQWAKPGDIVFFMHSKTSISKITKLCTLLEEEKCHYTTREYNLMKSGLQRAKDLYKKYGGKIYGVAKVIDFPEKLEDEESSWNNRIFAEMAEVTTFRHPLDIADFRDFITISRTGAITPIFDSQFDLLREKLSADNALPRYVMESEADPESLGRINRKNWLELANRYRMHFMLEEQFRAFYVNYLLRSMTSYVYRECRCKKQGIPDSYADNVIRIGKKYLPVEVKLLVGLWPIKDQVCKYCYDDAIILDTKGTIVLPDQIWRKNALVIDTRKIYMYNADNDSLDELYDLDNLSFDGIHILRKKIVDVLNCQA